MWRTKRWGNVEEILLTCQQRELWNPRQAALVGNYALLWNSSFKSSFTTWAEERAGVITSLCRARQICLRSIESTQKCFEAEKEPLARFQSDCKGFFSPLFFHEQTELFKWSPEPSLSEPEKWNNWWYLLRASLLQSSLKFRFQGPYIRCPAQFPQPLTYLPANSQQLQKYQDIKGSVENDSMTGFFTSYNHFLRRLQ